MKPAWDSTRNVLLMDAEANHRTNLEARQETRVRLEVWKDIGHNDDSTPVLDSNCNAAFGIAAVFNTWAVDRRASFCARAYGDHNAETDDDGTGRIQTVSRTRCSTVWPTGEEGCSDDSPSGCEVPH